MDWSHRLNGRNQVCCLFVPKGSQNLNPAIFGSLFVFKGKGSEGPG